MPRNWLSLTFAAMEKLTFLNITKAYFLLSFWGCGKSSIHVLALWPLQTKASYTRIDAPFSSSSQKSQFTYIFKTPEGLPNTLEYYSSALHSYRI